MRLARLFSGGSRRNRNTGSSRATSEEHAPKAIASEPVLSHKLSEETIETSSGGTATSAPDSDVSDSETSGAGAQHLEDRNKTYTASWRDPTCFADEGDRLALLQSLQVLQSAPEQRFDCITKLMATIFETPVALVSLSESEQLWFKSVTGPFGSCLNRKGSFCDIVLVPDEPEVLVIEDMTTDSRFSQHPNVVGPPHLRFYAGAPLVASTGHRYGTLCILDVKSRTFSAPLLNTLVNFAELASRELELSMASSTKLKHLSPLVRSSAAFEEPVSMVDLSKQGWPLLYCNAAWARDAAMPSYPVCCEAGAGGGDDDGACGKNQVKFWDLFDAVDPNDIEQTVPDALQNLRPATFIAKRKGPMAEMVGQVQVLLRPASDILTTGASIGIPGFVPFEGGISGSSMGSPSLLLAAQLPQAQEGGVGKVTGIVTPYWFVTLRKADSPRPSSLRMSRGGTSSRRASQEGPGTPPSTVANERHRHGAAEQMKRESFESDTSMPELSTTPRGVVMDSTPEPDQKIPAAAPTVVHKLLEQMPAATAVAPRQQQACCSGPTVHQFLPSLNEQSIQVATAEACQTVLTGASRLMTSNPREYLPYGVVLPERYADMQIGPLLGFGSYARVHRAVWKGHLVAVKLVELLYDSANWEQVEKAITEGVLSSELRHPNIVRTLDVCHWRRAVQPDLSSLVGGSGGSGGSSSNNSQSLGGFSNPSDPVCDMDCVWIVQELCDHGKLGDALDRGWLRQYRTFDAPPDMPALLRTASDIAAALTFLHSLGVIHGDLTYNNVLLSSSKDDPRGFIARVADFGMAKIVQESTMRTQHYGTVSHMPPELMSDGELGTWTDVYSLGVLIWEMWTGVRAWCGQRPAQIIMAVTSGQGLKELPEEAPAPLRDLVARCLSDDKRKRPNAAEVWVELQAMMLSNVGM